MLQKTLLISKKMLKDLPGTSLNHDSLITLKLQQHFDSGRGCDVAYDVNQFTVTVNKTADATDTTASQLIMVVLLTVHTI